MGYDMTQITETFKDAQVQVSSQQSEEVKLFTEEVSDFKFDDNTLLIESEESAFFYVAGYIQVFDKEIKV